MVPLSEGSELAGRLDESQRANERDEMLYHWTKSMPSSHLHKARHQLICWAGRASENLLILLRAPAAEARRIPGTQIPFSDTFNAICWSPYLFLVQKCIHTSINGDLIGPVHERSGDDGPHMSNGWKENHHHTHKHFMVLQPTIWSKEVKLGLLPPVSDEMETHCIF